MTGQATLYSFVNRWECDENDHLNVQFYFGRFEEADRQFRLLSGFGETLAGLRRVRHVRYHSELMCGDLITIYSSIAFDGPHMLTVVHEMRNSTTGEIAATALDGYEPNLNSAKSLRQRFADFQVPMIDEAQPKGLSTGPANLRTTLDGLLSRNVDICFRGTVLPKDVGVDGRADDRFVVGSCTDGVPHVWEKTPMNLAYLDEHGLGRIAAEMKLTWATPLKSGDSIVIATSFTGASDKTFNLRHHMFESRTNRLVATLDVVAMLMDLETRQAVSFPENAAKLIGKLVVN